MEGLTKENFFDELTEKFPEAMVTFNNWIDEYKVRVNWNKLFMAGVCDQNIESIPPVNYAPPILNVEGTIIGFGKVTNGKVFSLPDDSKVEFITWNRAPKFHEIPYAMQIGILLQFICESLPDEAVDLFSEFMDQELPEVFKQTIQHLNNKK